MTSRFGPVYVSIAGYMIAACACAALAAAGRVGPQTHHAGTGKLVPVDDCRTDPQLASFRNTMLKSIAQRSVEAFGATLGPMIQIDFEAPVTREALLRDLAEGPWDSHAQFWRDVRDALELGISKSGNGAYAPAVYLALGDSDYDMVTTGKDLKTYAEPNTSSRVVATLAFDLVNQGPDDNNASHSIIVGGLRYDWQQIVTPSGEDAWVPAKYVRDRFNTRLYFEKIDGRWKLTSILAGD